MLLILRGLTCKGRGRAGGLSCADGDDDAVAFDAGRVSRQIGHVQHDSASTVRFGGENRRHGSDIDVLAPRRQCEHGIGKVERDARRIVDRKRQRLRSSTVELETQLEALTGQRHDVD
jgi:hypothetical protein